VEGGEGEDGEMTETYAAKEQVIQTIVGERLHSRIRATASGEVVADMIQQATVTCLGDMMTDEFVVAIEAWMWGVKGESITYPKDWWQAFKGRWFPAWAKRRWPIIVEHFTPWRVFQGLAIPEGTRTVDLLVPGK
jgi:hypothetical protein